MTREVLPGKVYVLTKDGPVEAEGKAPGVWACRRVEDFPEGAIEALAAKGGNPGFAICEECHAPIVFNAARTETAPKVCMQCMGITPDPYP